MPSTVGIVSGAGSLKNPAEPALLGYRVNYIKNPSFEVNTSGYIPLSGSTLARTTSESFTGSASLSVTNSSLSGVQIGSTGTNNMIPLVGASNTYYFSLYIKLAPANTTALYGLQQIQYVSESGGAYVSISTVASQQLSPTGNWVRLGGSFTKNAAANFCLLRVTNSSSVSGEVYYIDSVLFENTSTLKSYFDGSSNGFWTGTQHASFSGATPY